MTELYKCSWCGAIYDSRETAEGCEKFHIGPSKVTALCYHPREKYPVQVEVRMTDGTYAAFTRPNKERYLIEGTSFNVVRLEERRPEPEVRRDEYEPNL